MTQEALKQALEELADRFSEGWHEGIKIDASDIMLLSEAAEALAQPEQDNTYTYASSLATTIWQKHYIKESPKFALLDTTEGVLTQIDNMTCGLVREKLAQPEQEPVAYLTKRKIGGTEGLLRADMVDRSAKNQETHDFIPLYTTPPQRPWVGLTDEEIQECYSEAYKIVQGRRLENAFYKTIEAKLKERNT